MPRSTRMLVLLLFVFSGIGCAFVDPIKERVIAEDLLAWGEPSTTPRGVALLLHGLNTKPEVMAPLAALFVENGYAAAVVRLSGHREDGSLGSAEVWRREGAYALSEVGRRYQGLPLIFVGYSSGAALGLSLIDGEEDPPRMTAVFLLAPSVGLRPYTGLMRAMTLLSFDSLIVPSLGPREYRARSTTTIGAYRGVFEISDEVYELKHPERLSGIPGVIFTTRGDELVCTKRVRQWLSRNQLTEWEVNELDGAGEHDLPEHLIIAPEVLGSSGWRELSDRVTRLLHSLENSPQR